MWWCQAARPLPDPRRASRPRATVLERPAERAAWQEGRAPRTGGDDASAGLRGTTGRIARARTAFAMNRLLVLRCDAPFATALLVLTCSVAPASAQTTLPCVG